MTSGVNVLCFALLFLSCVDASCLGQTVTVRIVNVQNESPVRNRHVYVSGLRAKTATNEDEGLKLVMKPMTADLSLITDTNGDATFELPKPAPADFYVRAALSGSEWDCTCTVRVSTEEVVEKGFVVWSPYAERKPKPSIQPKPGLILFSLRPIPWYVRVLWPFLSK